MKTEHVKNELTGDYDYKTVITSDQYYLIRKALRALDTATVEKILNYRASMRTMQETDSFYDTHKKSLEICIEEHLQIKEMFKDL